MSTDIPAGGFLLDINMTGGAVPLLDEEVSSIYAVLVVQAISPERGETTVTVFRDPGATLLSALTANHRHFINLM